MTSQHNPSKKEGRTISKKKNLLLGLEDKNKDVKEEEGLLESLLKPEEEEEDFPEYATTEDLALLHKSLEAKLLTQQIEAERAAEQRNKALESKIEALMTFLNSCMTNV